MAWRLKAEGAQQLGRSLARSSGWLALSMHRESIASRYFPRRFDNSFILERPFHLG